MPHKKKLQHLNKSYEIGFLKLLEMKIDCDIFLKIKKILSLKIKKA